MDEITEYVATKLTQGQKRGYEPAKASNREFHNDRRTLDAPALRAPQEVHAAQLQLAALALEKPDSAQWLADVLEALGIREFVQGVARTRRPGDCAGHRGTLRGYNIHLRNYTSPCTPCANARHRELLASMVRLGVLSEAGGEKWTLRWS